MRTTGPVKGVLFGCCADAVRRTDPVLRTWTGACPRFAEGCVSAAVTRHGGVVSIPCIELWDSVEDMCVRSLLRITAGLCDGTQGSRGRGERSWSVGRKENVVMMMAMRGVDSASHFLSDHEYCAPESRAQETCTRRISNGHLGVDRLGIEPPPTPLDITRCCEYMVQRYNTAQHSARSDTDIDNYTYPSLHQFSSCVCTHCPACTMERDQTTSNSALRAGPLTAMIFPAP